MLKLNPNKNIVTKIIDRIFINEGHCPCLPDRNEDTICPCKDMRENSLCHCSLYVEK